MKHEFETTKTTKNINDLLPATDEELGIFRRHDVKRNGDSTKKEKKCKKDKCSPN